MDMLEPLFQIVPKNGRLFSDAHFVITVFFFSFLYSCLELPIGLCFIGVTNVFFHSVILISFRFTFFGGCVEKCLKCRYCKIGILIPPVVCCISSKVPSIFSFNICPKYGILIPCQIPKILNKLLGLK